MNSEVKEILEHLLRLMGFEDFSVSYSEDSRRFSLFINDAPFLAKHLANVVNDFDFIVKMILKRKDLPFVFLDINNYRKEREEIIIKLAKAAARKALATKQEISLPPMNAYERRIIHSELALNPDLKTESFGQGKERHVVIRPLAE
jgi:spoIIIJ-associated protein